MAVEHPNLLALDPRPLFFPVANVAEIGLEPPGNRHGQPVRVWARALAGMQKEAVVLNGATGRAWRLVSDEGPYLAGHDIGPCPLSFLTTGMVASVMDAIDDAARNSGVGVGHIELVLDNYYTMEGSARAGTMTGGARNPRLTVQVGAGGDDRAIEGVITDALATVPVGALLSGGHPSLFTLVHNGREIEPARVAGVGRPAERDPGERFAEVVTADLPAGTDPIRKLVDAARVEATPGGVNTSLQEHQSRTLHVRGTCTRREDGVKVIEQSLFSPIGSTFRYLSDEAPERGGRGLAPDAASYVAAGIGFCFMTQLGRYAEIVRKDLRDYRIVQDLHLSDGSGPARAAPVETHVFVDSGEDDDFARTLLDMGEQTCFLHALCRSDVELEVAIGEDVQV